MKNKLLPRGGASFFALCIGVLLVSAGCEGGLAPTSQGPQPPPTERSEGGLAAAGSVSASSRYVLISTTGQVSTVSNAQVPAPQGALAQEVSR